MGILPFPQLGELLGRPNNQQIIAVQHFRKLKRMRINSITTSQKMRQDFRIQHTHMMVFAYHQLVEMPTRIKMMHLTQSGKDP